jgi:hypothetical protein
MSTIAASQARNDLIARHISSSYFLTTVPLVIVLVLVIAALPFKTWLGFLPIAWFFGWTQMGGRCGTAHVSTMLHFWRMSRKMWLKASIAYAVAGLISSAIVGMLLGELGHLIGIYLIRVFTWSGVAALSIVLAARELGILRFALIEKRCQTNRTWLYDFGAVHASAMWGFHIGIGFLTVITYGGYWVLVFAIVALGNVGVGALLMTVYWIGRSSPLWVLPPHLNAPWKVDSKLEVFRVSQAIAMTAFSILAVLMLG